MSTRRTGVHLIADERRRQTEAEGWTTEHDDEHGDGSLAMAAASYALAGNRGGGGSPDGSYPPSIWPWAIEWWKPTPNDRVRELVKAGALIAAEIDRLQRALPANQPEIPDGSPAATNAEALRAVLERIGREFPQYAGPCASFLTGKPATPLWEDRTDEDWLRGAVAMFAVNGDGMRPVRVIAHDSLNRIYPDNHQGTFEEAEARVPAQLAIIEALLSAAAEPVSESPAATVARLVAVAPPTDAEVEECAKAWWQACRDKWPNAGWSAFWEESEGRQFWLRDTQRHLTRDVSTADEVPLPDVPRARFIELRTKGGT